MQDSATENCSKKSSSNDVSINDISIL